MSREHFLPDPSRLVSGFRLTEGHSRHNEADIPEQAFGDRTRETERVFSARVHDALADVLQRVEMTFSELPRALRVSALSAMLLHAETAMAQSFASEQASKDSMPFFEGELLSDSAKKSLAELRAKHVDVQISTNGSYIQDFSLDTSFDRHSLVISGDVSALRFSRQVSYSNPLDTIDTSFHFEKIEESHDELGRISALMILAQDEFGNDFTVRRTLNPDGISYAEKISVFPAKVYTDARKNISLRINTSFIKDFPDVRELFWVSTYPTIIKIDNIPVVNDVHAELSDAEIEKLIGPHVDDIRVGLRSVQETFSFDTSIINRISVNGDIFAYQAFADSAQGQIFMGLGLFMNHSNSQEVSMEEGVRSAIQHEMFHVADFKLNISHSDVLKNFFYKTPRHILGAFSEHRFDFDEHTVREGHAADNPEELFASVMNGLDDPQWEKRVDMLTPEERAAYKEVLTIIHNVLLNHSQIKRDAPVHEQLRTRLAYLK